MILFASVSLSYGQPAPTFDFAMRLFTVDGNLHSSGKGPDGIPDFFDDFSDGSLTTPPTSYFHFDQGLAATQESGGFLRFRSADGYYSILRYGYQYLLDDAILTYPLRDGYGNAEIIGDFRADTPEQVGQFYGIGIDNFGPGARESVSLVVSKETDGNIVVSVNDQTGTTLAADLVTLPSNGFIRFKLFIDDAANEVYASYSLDNGLTYRNDTQFDYYSRHGTVFSGTPAPWMYAFAQGGVRVYSSPDLAAAALGNSCNIPSGYSSEPVNTATGNYVFSRTDLVIPGRGIPLVFQRTYNSQDSYSGPLGIGWTHSYNIILKANPDGSVSIKWGDGHSDFFDLHPDGTYSPRYGWIFDNLQKQADGTFHLTKKDQTVYIFDATGKLTAITDKNGNALAFAYDVSGNLIAITDTVGRTYVLTYNPGNRLTQLTDPIGRVVRYGYDSNGNLASVTNPNGGTVSFSYDVQNRLAQIVDERGTQLVANVYDSSSRVTTQTNGRGYATTFAYGVPQSGDTTITDPLGNITVHTHDAQLRLIKITDANGKEVKYTYDASNNRTSITDQNGNITYFGYDGQGNITSITNPLGNVITFTYDPKNNLTSATNARGFNTAFTYDSRGSLTTIQDAAGNSTTFAYNSPGQLIQRADARGNLTKYSYDTQGNLTGITDALGGKRNLAYDGIGRLLSLTDPNGHTAGASYDVNSRLTQIVDPLGNKTRFSYDPTGNLNQILDAKGNQTQFAYDEVYNLNAVTDALGHITRYAYDANNNRITMTNANNNSTIYVFDALNRLISITDPLGNITDYTYDPVGNVVATMDANGTTNTFTYDQNNRLRNIAYGDLKSVAYSYDANGNRLNMVDSRGTTTYLYDSLDRLVDVDHPAGTVKYAYDQLGNRISLTYPDGRIVSYNYDALNRLKQVTDWTGRSTLYTYDPASNLLQTNYPNATKISYRYDAGNRLLGIQHSRGALFAGFTYTLDQLGNRFKLDENVIGLPTPVKTSIYTYDALSQLLSVEKQLFTKSYDRLQYSYDPVGNRLSQTELYFNRKKGWVPLNTVPYTYDASDRLLQAGNTTFGYDANGNRLTKSIQGSLVESYIYDAANRLIQVEQPSADLTYTYDGDGNKVGNAVHHNSTTDNFSFLNDVATPLPVVLQEDGPKQSISYAYGLNIISEELLSKGLKNPSRKTFFYHADGLGSTVALSDQLGLPEAVYGYDAWGNLLEEFGNIPNRFLFTGQELDDFTGFYYLRARWYDPSVGRFLNKDPFAGLVIAPRTTNRFTYASNNPINFVDPSGLWVIGLGFEGKAGALLGASVKGFFVVDNYGHQGFAASVGGGLFSSVSLTAGGTMIILPRTSATIDAVSGLGSYSLGATVNAGVGDIGVSALIDPSFSSLKGISGSVGGGPSFSPTAGSINFQMTATGVSNISDRAWDMLHMVPGLNSIIVALDVARATGIIFGISVEMAQGILNQISNTTPTKSTIK